MPIKGLTDQLQQFIEIGQLRKGAPKPKKGNRPGEDLTHFRATFMEGEEQAAVMFHDAYGSKPREINIRLPFDTVDENFDAWQESYVRGGLIHRCDGEYVQYEVDHNTGDVLVRNGLGVADGKLVKCDGRAECKPTGRLKVIVPELRRLAFVVALTTSVWDILNISRQLEAIRCVNDGRLQKVPLILKRRPREISTPSGEGGKKARRVKWLLSIEADPAWVEASILRLPPPEELETEILTLPSGVEEAEESDWDTKYPGSMTEFVEWGESLGCSKSEMRSAVAEYLKIKFPDSALTPEQFKDQVGEAEAARVFWDAILDSVAT